MAKKAAKAKARTKRGKKPVGRPASGQKPIAYQMRASQEFHDWMKAVQKADHASTLTEMIVRAIIGHARTLGVKQEPPER